MSKSANSLCKYPVAMLKHLSDDDYFSQQPMSINFIANKVNLFLVNMAKDWSLSSS